MVLLQAEQRRLAGALLALGRLGHRHPVARVQAQLAVQHLQEARGGGEGGWRVGQDFAVFMWNTSYMVKVIIFDSIYPVGF